MLQLLLLLTTLVASTAASPAEVWIIDIDDAIGPASADHVIRNLREANEQNAVAVILRMNTPGGLDQSMRGIIKEILASDVPVIGYVAPRGSRAASAGTYILYASHIAAMAPATNLGAATPVQMGAPGGLPTADDDPAESDDHPDEQSDEEGESAPAHTSPRRQPAASASEQKAINDARAYIRGLAELRNRNAEWAERSVTEAATLSYRQALENNVIDLIAIDEQALLDAIDGRTVTTSSGERTLDTAGATLHQIVPDWRTQFLGVITNPSVAYILMLLGIYGLIMEFSNPGTGIGGIIGGICLLLALYAMQVLPISYTALALILLGLALMAAEAFSPSFGILGIGGVVAFIIGSIMLMDTQIPAFQIALPVILAVAAASAGMMIIVLRMLLRSRRHPVVSGVTTLTGAIGVVMRLSGANDEVNITHANKAQVKLHGEIWNAQADHPLQPGDRVRVIAVDGLTLQVEKEE